jgi:uncharacterized protein (DUF952 family)
MSADNRFIHHLVLAAEFDAIPASAPYIPARFQEDGFIHCTRDTDDLRQVANILFARVPGDFLVLTIDTTRLQSLVRFEPPIPAPPVGSRLADVLFPHIYGPLNRDAVVSVREARRGPDGSFIQT